MEFELSVLTHFPEVLVKLQIAFSDFTELSSTPAELCFKQKQPCCVRFLGFLFLPRSYSYFLRFFIFNPYYSCLLSFDFSPGSFCPV